MDIYREKLLDHYNNPRNYGELSLATNTSSMENVSCGDALTMQTLIKKDRVADLKFTGEGCAIAIAAASILTEYAKGKNITALADMHLDDLLKLMGVQLTPSRLKCAGLSLETLKKAIANVKNT